MIHHVSANFVYDPYNCLHISFVLLNKKYHTPTCISEYYQQQKYNTRIDYNQSALFMLTLQEHPPYYKIQKKKKIHKIIAYYSVYQTIFLQVNNYLRKKCIIIIICTNNFYTVFIPSSCLHFCVQFFFFLFYSKRHCSLAYNVDI